MSSEENASIMIDSDLWQRFLVFITMAYGGTGDVVEYVEQALRGYMENHVSEFDEKMQELCSHDTQGINDVFVVEE
ncbi:MAG: hypothetical protein NWE83_07950 [Candidatus Bathyarchaeota archaeon]|jgi:hypothetical protein|nr:hypothetical protein [Candidatus Bathyarchaeota archaeon]